MPVFLKALSLLVVPLFYLLLVTSTFAQDFPPICTSIQGMILEKLVDNAAQCDTECYLPTLGDGFFCLKQDDGSKEKVNGQPACVNPDANTYRSPLETGNCVIGMRLCNTSGIETTFCEVPISRKSATEDNSSSNLVLSGNNNPLADLVSKLWSNLQTASSKTPLPPPPPPPATPQGPGPAGILQLQQIITRVINLSVALAFIALTVVLVISGIKFLTSGGDPKAIQSASQSLTWALLGILFLAIAWLILKLIEAFTGVPVTQFCLGFPGASTQCP